MSQSNNEEPEEEVIPDYRHWLAQVYDVEQVQDMTVQEAQEEVFSEGFVLKPSMRPEQL